jgi:SAM-dependent methyltransferase
MEEGYWDEVAAAWAPGRALWRRHSDAVNARLVSRWLPAGAGGRILKTDLFDEFADEGLYPALLSCGERVTGIDVSPAIVAAARRRYPGLEAEVADVRRLPFETGAFDAAVSNSTLDHFSAREEVAAALAELARVLRPGGRLVVTLDNPLNPLIAIRNALPRRAARAVRRVPYNAGWTCGPRRLRTLLSGAGFAVVEVTAVLHAPRVLVVELGRLRRVSSSAERWLRPLLAMERLADWPTGLLTGHYVAALAVRSPRGLEESRRAISADRSLESVAPASWG